MTQVMLFFSMFLVILNFTMPMMAGVYIVGDLGGSTYTTSYAISFYAMGGVMALPLILPLSHFFGTKKMYIVCLILLAFFSLACGLVTYYPVFIGMRFLEGVVSAPVYVLARHILSHMDESERKDNSMYIAAVIFTVTPSLGAVLGGWIAYSYHWRWAFWFSMPLFMLTSWYLGSVLKVVEKFTEKRKLNRTGYFFYALGVFSMGVVLSMAQQLDWYRSTIIIACFLLGIIGIAYFFVSCYKCDNPVIDLRLFKNIIFSFSIINVFLLFSLYFGMIILLALWLKLYVNYTPLWIGLIIGCMALASFLPVLIIRPGKFQVDVRAALFISIMLFAISSFHTSHFNIDINFGRIAFSRVLAGLGLALFLPSLYRLIAQCFTQERLLEVNVIFHIARLLGSGFGASLYVILWQRRQVFYYDRLGSQLTAFSQNTQNFFTTAKQVYLQGKPAAAQLNYYLEHQATVLALDDCFYLMAWITVALLGLFFLVWFLKREAFRARSSPPVNFVTKSNSS